MEECSAEHPVFYEDEVDIHLNPKIGVTGSCADSRNELGRRGQNEILSQHGAPHSGTGKAATWAQQQSSALFVAAGST